MGGQDQPTPHGFTANGRRRDPRPLVTNIPILVRAARSVPALVGAWGLALAVGRPLGWPERAIVAWCDAE